jgi:hypothetical protein
MVLTHFFDSNSSASGRGSYRDVIRQDGRIVAEHPRSFGRGETTYDPWHYVPVLARKPGALRNGAPFKDWVLPAAIERRRLASTDDGNRQMVDILNAVLTDGLPAVESWQKISTLACEQNHKLFCKIHG